MACPLYCAPAPYSLHSRSASYMCWQALRFPEFCAQPRGKAGVSERACFRPLHFIPHLTHPPHLVQARLELLRLHQARVAARATHGHRSRLRRRLGGSGGLLAAPAEALGHRPHSAAPERAWVN